MGIGTAKEGGESVVEPIGIGRNIGSDSDSSSIETDDEVGGREPDGQSGEEVDIGRNESQEGNPIDAGNQDGMDGSEPPPLEEPENPPRSPNPVIIGEGRYSLDGSSLSVMLHPQVIRTIRSSIPPKTDGGKWRPVLAVDPNGAMNVHWEPVD